jgi:simple sugar transport system permease protein
VLTLAFWLLTTRSVYGFSVRTVGAAPNAARYGGFDASRTVWTTLMISGGMAGLAGILEVASQLGQINLGFPSGYGFTAIIVSFLGRLNPIGVFLAGLILAVTYVGGQVAQTVVHVPNATAGIFQATMLFFILASDILVRYRVRIIRDAPRVAPAEAVA